MVQIIYRLGDVCILNNWKLVYTNTAKLNKIESLPMDIWNEMESKTPESFKNLISLVSFSSFAVKALSIV